MELTILMPCLNEERTVAACVANARKYLDSAQVVGEVLIADNGSSDGSVEKAEAAGARVISVPQRGYGAALIAGIAAAKGRYVIMGDADCSYDFSSLGRFMERLRSGSELVMGNRFAGGIMPGAMPPLHRYLGNPVLSGIGRLLFRTPIRDFHCGLRGFDREAMRKLNLSSTGMEFASEMVVKSSLQGLKISEVPTILMPDGRDRPPHLRSWRDGWRHLRFLLLYSPTWLFLYPGLILLSIGLLLECLLLGGSLRIGSVSLGVHTLLYGGAFAMVGLQMCIFAILSKAFAVNQRLLPESRRLGWFLRKFSLEKGLIVGAIAFLTGFVTALSSVGFWISHSLGPLNPVDVMRLAIPAVWLMVGGAELMMGSFFLSLLHADPNRNANAP